MAASTAPPGVRTDGGTRDVEAGLDALDAAPTLADLLGQTTADMSGASLAPRLRRPEARRPPQAAAASLASS